MTSNRTRRRIALTVSLAFFLFLGVLTGSNRISILIPALYLVTGLISCALYARDKHAAIHGQRRIPENTLHFVSLVGGWPAALPAAACLHHKTLKQPFRNIFRLTVCGNCTLLALYLYFTAP
ncbi:MAG: DUF1294 domain-containing protein [Desulforhopalus sp.]|nr:DUF1294 domain-containing protein [Desulforhopalus sp.]